MHVHIPVDGERGFQRIVNAEAASALAVKLQSPSRKSVQSILKTGRDQHPAATTKELELELPAHPNVRGPTYYH